MRIDRRPPTVLPVLAAAAIAAGCAAFGGMPAAPPRVAPQTLSEVHHGVRVADPYRQLETVAEPATRAWYRAQGEYAAATLARIPGREALLRRIAEIQQVGGPSYRRILRMPGGRVWLLRRLPGESQHQLVLREASTGAERVVVDTEAITKAAGRPHAVDWFRPSWDGKMLAYGLSAGGSEESTMHVVDVASGTSLVPPEPRVHHGGNVVWTPDGRTLIFTQSRELPPGAADSERYLDATAFTIEPRLAGARPRPLFGPLVNRGLGLQRLDVPEFVIRPGSRWMVARTTDTTVPEGRLFVAPLAALGQGAGIDWKPIATAADRIQDVALRGDTLYLLSHAGAPRGRILALDLDGEPALARARVAVTEPAEGAIVDMALGPASIDIALRSDFGTRAVRHEPGRPPSDLAPTLDGSTALARDPSQSHAEPWLFHFSWTAPTRLVSIEAGTPRGTGIPIGVLPPGAPELTAVETRVRSHDGAMVPVAIVHRKDLPKGRPQPTLLEGYGAYGSSFEAGLDPLELAWLERGGVLAFANVRGSGALGDAWHRAGFKQTKANTWKDGIAVARWLVSEGYASPRTLGIMGTSAGGIFVGRAVTEAPELFAAAIFDVGVLDAVRAEESANGITNISEFGTARSADEFPSLLAMSTYHQIQDGAAYPAVLLIHGLNDPRVDVWHSGKTAARLQAATSSGKPVLLRLDGEAGHGGGTRQQVASKQADIYGFLLWQFGLAAP